ncbi:TPA: 23S rRNA methyltransferase attenuation leader peptide, partial [Streptococcus pneumoniae]|nr:23S rRNA methyltransferase attenuation leader peptide [Enterococcus faecium]HET0655425.1 23S rRNA methyltransferase attenuation leader peptide [Streptococcus pneumoniae]HAR0961683.1 23S rRNA methyltransferase attenuation leader peptide [Enterococcus faecium]HBL3690965.1 23S rRNA methyltransferase attenuation leader peptide [Enterococcus faecium]HCR2342147.1 23S rRNA methyltransferase attenuation leader peptide [Enterococcus faecium]
MLVFQMRNVDKTS